MPELFNYQLTVLSPFLDIFLFSFSKILLFSNSHRPALCLPGSKKASIGVCFCPIIFENMTHKENMADKENQSSNESMFK